MKENTKAHLGVLLTNVFFAFNYSLIKYLSPSMAGPYGLNLARVAISMLMFWGLWLFGKNAASIHRRDWPRFFWCALTGVAINQMLFMKGLTLTSTIHASLLMLSTPILITFFAFWILKERLTILKSAGLALGIGGATILILARDPSLKAENYVWGDLLIMINALSYAMYFILVQPLMKRYHPIHVIRWVFTLGFFMVLPFGWSQFNQINWQAFTFEQHAAFWIIVVCGTFLAYLFNIYGLLRLGAGITGAYIYTQPAFVAIIAIAFLDEALSWQKLVAGLMIFAGVFFVSRQSKRRY